MAFAAHHGYHSYVDGNGQQQQQHQQQHQHQHYPQPMPPQMSCDIKPRLTKEQHDILESHFQKQSKPSTITKKGFAETLNVSLDKVNNWFQNRRAKSKHDAKKQAGAYNLYAQQAQTQSSAFNSDSDTSPSFTSPEYYTMMQQSSSDDQISNPLGFNPGPFDEPSQPYAGNPPRSEQFNNANLMPPEQNMFDSPQEMNRRTLTQEAFDAFTHNAGVVMQQSGQFDSLQQSYNNADLQHAFADMDQNDFKDNGAFSFPPPPVAPLSSNDSSIPSTISEQSMFPSSSAMQEHAALSAPTSDWTDSRSSSVSNSDSEDLYQMMAASQQQTSSSQWQPGQSVPVDPSELHQHFREVERQAQQQQSTHTEQSLAFCDDEFVRSDSQNGTALAHQLSSFGIETPQPQQSATFKAPTPPQSTGGSIAARRQRPRPAALGIASLRSQSYSGAAQPASPSQQTQNLVTAQQQLRRIRSSNVINGVAQGRVMKSTPGSAQRSPLNWTFSEANLVNQRSASSSNTLAPPTPLSPRHDQARPQFPSWQSSGSFVRQASISELDSEHNVVHAGIVPGPPERFTSPPNTPMYHPRHTHQMGHGIGSTIVTENTPPQSAPAVQTTFPAHAFMPPPPQPMPPQSQAQPVQFQRAFQTAHGQHVFNMSVPEQQFQMPPQSYAAAPFVGPAPESAPHSSVSFANGVPVVNPQGQLAMVYPPQMQQLQFVSHSPGQPPPSSQQYSFVTNAGTPPGMHVTSQLPKQYQPPVELFVHEYSPPSDVKRAATPRKSASDGGPKNFVFHNDTSETLGKSKAKKTDVKSGTALSSPGSGSS